MLMRSLEDAGSASSECNKVQFLQKCLQVGNRSQTDPKRTPNGPRMDLERRANEPRTDPERTTNGSWTDSKRRQTEPEQIRILQDQSNKGPIIWHGDFWVKNPLFLEIHDFSKISKITKNLLKNYIQAICCSFQDCQKIAQKLQKKYL